MAWINSVLNPGSTSTPPAGGSGSGRPSVAVTDPAIRPEPSAPPSISRFKPATPTVAPCPTVRPASRAVPDQPVDWAYQRYANNRRRLERHDYGDRFERAIEQHHIRLDDRKQARSLLERPKRHR